MVMTVHFGKNRPLWLPFEETKGPRLLIKLDEGEFNLFLLTNSLILTLSPKTVTRESITEIFRSRAPGTAHRQKATAGQTKTKENTKVPQKPLGNGS